MAALDMAVQEGDGRTRCQPCQAHSTLEGALHRHSDPQVSVRVPERPQFKVCPDVPALEGVPRSGFYMPCVGHLRTALSPDAHLADCTLLRGSVPCLVPTLLALP